MNLEQQCQQLCPNLEPLHTNNTQRSLRYEDACLWNCLDNRAKVSTTLKELKRHFIIGRTTVHL